MIGQCRLCLRHAVELKKSHFLSAGIYRLIRDDKKKNPNPYLLSRKGSIQTSWQITAHLLCDECEQRISKGGENWVLRHCARTDGNFPLASILASKPPDLSGSNTATRVYRASRIPEIDISALTYFAASMFWRGSIYPWKDDGSIPVKLGPYGDQLRQYLLGAAAFPADCSLWIVVREASKFLSLTHTPIGGRGENFHVYRFPIPGLAFTLLVGKRIPAKCREVCFVHGAGHPIVVSPNVEPLLEEAAFKLLRQSLQKVNEKPKKK